MKKLLLLLCVAITIQSCATYTPVSMEPISQSFVIDKEKDEIFVSANNWMVENFNNAKSVIQYTDKEAGIVTGRYLLKPLYEFEGYSLVESTDGIFAVIKIQVKDGASKITITPEDFEAVTGPSVNEKLKYSKQIAEAQVKDLITSYGNYVTNDTSQEW